MSGGGSALGRAGAGLADRPRWPAQDPQSLGLECPCGHGLLGFERGEKTLGSAQASRAGGGGFSGQDAVRRRERTKSVSCS